VELLRDREGKGWRVLGITLDRDHDLHAHDARAHVLSRAGLPDAVCRGRHGV
jgi:hypothetical protein